jgi:hypothetical protein
MLTPDPAALERVLREHEVNGNVLLIDVDDNVMRQDFGLKVLGRRAFIRGAIDELRVKSAKYQAHAHTHFNPSLVPSQYMPSPVAFASPFAQHGYEPAFPFQQPMSAHAHLGLQNSLLPQSLAAGNLPQCLKDDETLQNRLMSAGGENATLSPQRALLDGQPPETPANSQVTGNTFVVSDAAGSKRCKLDITEPNDMAFQPEEISPQLLRQLTPAEETDIPQDGNTPSMHLSTSPTPDPNLKKRKRIAPTLITSVVDPIEADAADGNDPSTIQPGVVFVGADGKKRLVPECLTAHDVEDPHNGEPLPQSRAPELPALDAGGERALAAAKNILEVAQQKKFAMLVDASSAGYLGKQGMPVDDVFYDEIEVGQELSNTKETTDFLEPPTVISSGRRLYVNSLMKHFLLRSERQIFSRGGKQYSAIRPYTENLAPRYQNLSFTLYYAGKDHIVRARREGLQNWPEIDTERLVSPVSQPEPNSDSITFEPGPWESYAQEFDPDTLGKWNNLSGGDEILPVYGESDEENEYDSETWREIEEEQGTLDRPLKPLKRTALSPEEVNQAIDEGIAEMVKKWYDVKLPKKHRKAFRIWKETRPRLSRQAYLKILQEHLDRMHVRITKMRKEILDETWTSKRQVHKQTRILELNIFDRESSIWEMSIIESQTRPEKPSPKPPSSKKSIVSTENGEEGESLGSDTEASSSDDDMDDFIVDDPPGTEDEIELNMADSEDEDEGNVITPFSSPSPSPSPSRNPSKGGLAKKRPIRSFLQDNSSNTDQVMPNANNDSSDSDAMNEYISMPQRLISPSSSSKSSTIKEELPIPKSHSDSPRKVSNIVDLTMTSSDEASRVVAPRVATPQVVNLITPKKKPTIKLINRNSPFSNSPSGSPIMISDEDQQPAPSRKNLPSLNDPATIAKFSSQAWTDLKDRKRLLITILYSMEPSLRNALYVFVSNITEDQFWSNMTEVMDAILDGSDSLRGMDPETFKTLVRFIRLFQMYTECKKRPLESPPKDSMIEQLKSARGVWFPEFYQFCRELEDFFFNRKASKERQLVNEDRDDEEDEGPQSAVKRRRVK